ncbi:myelin-associated glycoprotein-like [Mugil cephalus]|uniref:myelin-associated glycoprotein-like n=1 Tax=Mugil cephalus TaxID=48193 RepID=UPI001FB793F9|nr:myelin-associated glycoprotein-like [Mugil cephalus]
MPGFNFLILQFCLLGYVFVCSSAWRVMMPSHLKGLVGSCLVIPCRFDYNKYPPQRPDRVVWYQYVSRGYPLVYDDWYPTYVTYDIFRGKTQAYRSGYGKTCSLKIEPLTWSHHRQKLYPWVDPENIGKSTHGFYDTTVMIEVVDTADPPNLQIYGAKKVGHSVDVHCSVYHTCPTKPPTLSLNIPHGNQDRTPVELTDGTFKTTLKATLLIENDSQRVVCSVQYPTGHTKSTSSNINAECSILPLTISSTSNEFLEGYPSKVTCTATYTCSKHRPTLTWSYGNMPTSTATTKEAQWKTISTLTFTSSANDPGRSLTCYAVFSNGERQETSITLQVKKPLSIAPVIAVPLVVLILIILAVVLGVFICRRRRHTEDSMKPPPRPEKRNSFWNKLPRRQGNAVNLSVGYSNNPNTIISGSNFSEPLNLSPED